jgi:Ca2+-binding RTX toxin-like protein
MSTARSSGFAPFSAAAVETAAFGGYSVPNSLTGLHAATFNENTVNATPQLLDANVTLTATSASFNGGALTVSGLLAEDRVSIASGTTIYLSGGVVYYDADGAGGAAAVAIGTASGGVGATFTVTFNADATAEAIEALIESLTYTNVSDTPTASRDLSINVWDAAGMGVLPEAATFLLRTGAANPFISVGVVGYSAPALADLDGDGDFDLFLGVRSGTLAYYRNDGTASAPVFVGPIGGANPFNGVDVGDFSTLSFADLDGDGDLDAVVGEETGILNYFKNTGTASAPVFTEQTGAANPFNGIDVGLAATISLVDLDGDGDMDAVVGEYEGVLNYFKNTGTASAPVFTAQTGAANPLGSIDIGEFSAATFADLDGDGDLDLIIGEKDGVLNYFENTGTASAPAFTARTGTANPLNGYDEGLESAPAFADLNGDGDLDGVFGNNLGTLLYYENTASGRSITVNVTAQIEPPTATGLPTDVTVTEETASNLDLSAVAISYLDTTGSITVTLTASAGTMTAASGGGVTVSNSGTGAIMLSGTASTIDTFLNTASNIQYAGAADAAGDNAATLTITANDGTVVVTLGTVNIDITNVDDPMSLSGVATSVTFGENTVNATPQLLDADVGFVHGDNDYNGGTLTVSGLLAEDRVSIASGATISLSTGTVYYDADGAGGAVPVAIGTASGGSGATFTVTFNAAATSVAIDALIQNLTYANVSDTPTATRTLTINVTDSTGESLGGVAPVFTDISTATSPVTGFTSVYNASPAMADLDGDGDLDAVVGARFGNFLYFENTGTAASPVYTARTGAANPFNGFSTGFYGRPTLADLDGDGDLDLASGSSAGTLFYWENTGTSSAPVFTARTGAASPFFSFALGYGTKPVFVDFDGDGDADLFVGNQTGTIAYLENTGTASAASFVERTGAANPLSGIDVGDNAAPAFVDVDGDGDLDLVTGSSTGEFRYFENTGGTFAERTGAANPFNGFDGNGSAHGGATQSTPVFADIDGDGDLDLVSGERFDGVSFFRNDSVFAPKIIINVNAQAEGPGPGADTVTGTSGNDTVKGLGGNDTLDGGDGNDIVEGGDGDDDLTGGAGNDRMDGGPGADTMRGGAGDDVYYVSGAGDVVDETGGSGYDSVRSMISYTLGAGVERLELLFAAPINGTGNGLDNVIVGNGGANVLTGLAGDDTITGGSGNDTLRGGDDDDSLDGGAGNDLLEGGDGVDTLTGGAGVDRLDGGTGADAMSGGASGDVYVVDDLGDSITELAGGGVDAVEASITYTLGAELENLQLTGGSAINGTGNGLSNVITGNGAANILDGGAGADTLSGLGGADRLIGGAGADNLTGGLGADTFAFSSADIGAKVETDRILDLVFADGDVVDLSGIDANINLGGDQAFAWVTKFSKVAGQALMTYANGVTTIALDVNGDGKADFKIAITGDHTGTKGNLHTGGADTDGGWVL